MIVDSHVHVIAPDLARYPFTPRALSGQWYIDGPCSAEELLVQMDACGVDRAILVQAVGAYTFDNAYAADAARAHPARFVSAACIDPLADDAIGTLESWIRDAGMQGVRIFAVSRTDETWLDDPRTFPVWERAAELGAHLIVTIMNHQLPALLGFLDAFRDVPVSLDHCAFPDPTSPASLFALARYPKLHLKVTTHVLDATIEQAGEALPFVRQLVDAFGAERLMWGSDFCQIQGRRYAELVALGRSAFDGLPAAERAACLGGTAARLWGLEAAPDSTPARRR
ncbi:MAG: amidohydrolase family protein [Myxococcota bacterium]